MNTLRSVLLILLIATVETLSASYTMGQEKSPVHTKTLSYVSKIDGEHRPYYVRELNMTDKASALPLFVCVSPWGNEDNLKAATHKESLVEDIKVPYISLRVTGRGPGTLYMNYGEVDTLEAIEDVCRRYPIDRDRIYVFGSSMGGAATWYLTSHYPDVFAAGAPTCGYCDYKLWTMAGGRTYPLYPWEEASWKARSASLLIENFQHTPVWIQHGEWDRTTGGGVTVAHSRQMDRLLTEAGFPHKYVEIPKGPHGGGLDDKERILWLLAQRKQRNPQQVRFATFDLRHNKSYWVTIEQFLVYGGVRAEVDAKVEGAHSLKVNTKNVRTLSLGPIAGQTAATVTIDGESLGTFDLTTKKMFRRIESEKWSAGQFDLSREKRHGVAGGICDLFFENTIFVIGTGGSEEETHWLKSLAEYANGYYQGNNGGVHRGGIPGTTHVKFLIVEDTKLTEEQCRNNNLLLFGTFKTNLVLKRYEGKLPLKFGDKTIELFGKTFRGDEVTAFAVFPHPDHPERYMAVHGGVTPDGIMNSAYIHMGLLPDYFVYSGAENLGWGFCDNQWKIK